MKYEDPLIGSMLIIMSFMFIAIAIHDHRSLNNKRIFISLLTGKTDIKAQSLELH